MGYSTTLYGVDLERLRTALGSEDRALLARIKEAERDEFERSDDWFDEDRLTLAQALDDLIEGRVSRPDCGFQYAYALELLCRWLGAELPHDDLLGSLDDLEVETLLERARLPVEIPTPEDFPVVSHLTSEEVHGELVRLSAIDLSFPEDEDIEEARHALVRCLEAARKRGVGVVSFYY
ncbi:DUF7691 family protein [Tautonia plasticadhaerens]|uniref:DUF7691 domain-containing protein n=1 Tax=Tautonia plasticadhaerens TaxID=2527974 RepID=A0A518H3T2_9BACT|nr:hypothetical protein [Tautonia plasticadhaerens]QDV35514.1 hypothetical protein ElP_34170 [Tautonia plasticadhaerens]